VLQGLIVATAWVLFGVISVAVGLWVTARAPQVVAVANRQPVDRRWWQLPVSARWPVGLVVGITAVLWWLPGSLGLTLGLLAVLVVALVVVWSTESAPDLR
jgi:hypothetical protein